MLQFCFVEGQLKKSDLLDGIKRHTFVYLSSLSNKTENSVLMETNGPK